MFKKDPTAKNEKKGSVLEKKETFELIINDICQIAVRVSNFLWRTVPRFDLNFNWQIFCECMNQLNHYDVLYIKSSLIEIFNSFLTG